MARKIVPVSLLPFRLHNIEDFLTQNHPVYMPGTPAFEDYWHTQLERNIYGLWGHDYNKKTGEGGYRYMPKRLHFYINESVIKQGVRGREITAPPLLRDIDWFLGYDVTVCDGFAGFVDDKLYTGFYPVLKKQLNLELSETEEAMLDEYGDLVRDKYGKLKTFKHPLEILYDTYKDPVGNPLMINQKLNGLVMSTRGCGKSYSAACMLPLHDFVFNGAHTVEDYFSHATTATTVVGSYESKKSDELLSKMMVSMNYLKNEVGAYSYGDRPEDKENGVFWHPYSGSTQVGGVITKSVKTKSGQGTEGVDNKIPHVTWKVDASAGVGHRANVLIEEIGLLKNFDAVHGENTAVQIRDHKMYFTWGMGTGGDVTASRAISTAFYNPSGYDILSHKDKFTGTNKDIASFIPSYLRKNAFKDENGNSDVEKGFRDEMYERDRKKGNSHNYVRYCISYPILPREMFQQIESGYFPAQQIDEALEVIDSEPPKRSVGKFGNYGNTVSWHEDVKGELVPLDSPTADEKAPTLDGAVVIYEHPVQHKPARTLQNPMYIVFYDQVAKKGQTSPSLCVAFVFKTWDIADRHKMQFNIAAEWIGRKATLDENHKIVFDLAAYYDAYIFPETNLEDFERYATQIHKYHWLHPAPGELIDGIVKNSKKYDIGLMIVPGMIPTLRSYLNEVLMTVSRVYETLVGSEYERKEVRMVQEMKTRRGLEELQMYNETDNFDYVSALLLLGAWAKQFLLRPEYTVGNDSVSRAEQEYKDQVLKKRKEAYMPPVVNSAFNY